MKRSAPAALRNRGPLLEALREILSRDSRILEIGSGSGQHADFFTEHEPGWVWQPADVDPVNVASIEAYRTDARRDNFLPARRLDASQGADWPSSRYDAVFSANVVHISPWEVALGLFAGANTVLDERGVLVLYGPFRFSGAFTAPSNADFDARLRGENPSWGVRDVDDLEREAARAGFGAARAVAMPANNHVLVFRRATATKSDT